jgi:lipopolysaccharide/colanic/teichoic acid biosynthesis glycosyltransferase
LERFTHDDIINPFEVLEVFVVNFFCKRAMDLVLAGLGMLVLCAMLPFIALAICIDSGLPVFYRQERVGLNGKRFRILKLRTMLDDDQVTKVGRFLRRSHIDELPQLWNIFHGEMSMVGPRPERPKYVEKFEKEIPNYSLRHTVKPGLAGWAIVQKGYETTAEDALIKLPYDLYYIDHQSLSFDLAILIRTIMKSSRS